jgi:xanthine dehydrogenase accessory factor
VPPEVLASVRYPVGLDLGHTTHREVAVAILAELVALKSAGALPAAGAHVELPLLTAVAAEAIDPVCGMTVTANESGRPYEHDGITFYFCCPGCRHAFAKAPTSFLTQEAR